MPELTAPKKKLVIQFHPDGTVETLLKASVIDLRVLGHQSVDRVSEVLFDEDEQKFYIRWLKGPLAASPVACVHTGFYSVHFVQYELDGPKLFDTYEQAVECEIATVNAMRLDGVSFA